jgi:hypothetical protein
LDRNKKVVLNIIMIQKVGIIACLGLVLVGTVLAQSSCIDKVRGILNGPGGRTLMGGWRPIENPQSDAIVQGIMTSSTKLYNQQTNDLHKYELFENGNDEAYFQLVNGQNYCVQFTLVSNGCKNSLNGDYCRDGKKFICSVSAYKAFSDQAARVDPTKLVCTPTA